MCWIISSKDCQCEYTCRLHRPDQGRVIEAEAEAEAKRKADQIDHVGKGVEGAYREQQLGTLGHFLKRVEGGGQEEHWETNKVQCTGEIV